MWSERGAPRDSCTSVALARLGPQSHRRPQGVHSAQPGCRPAPCGGWCLVGALLACPPGASAPCSERESGRPGVSSSQGLQPQAPPRPHLPQVPPKGPPPQTSHCVQGGHSLFRSRALGSSGPGEKARCLVEPGRGGWRGARPGSSVHMALASAQQTCRLGPSPQVPSPPLTWPSLPPSPGLPPPPTWLSPPPSPHLNSPPLLPEAPGQGEKCLKFPEKVTFEVLLP